AHGAAAGRLVHVGDRHAGALRRERQRRGAPDPERTARHDHNLAVELPHRHDLLTVGQSKAGRRAVRRPAAGRTCRPARYRAAPTGRRGLTFLLTSAEGLPSRSASAICSIACWRLLTAEPTDVPARCGASSTLSSWRSGLSIGSGSVSNTSSPAPLIQPSRSARTSAGSSTTLPREVFTKNAPGFIIRNWASPSMW